MTDYEDEQLKEENARKQRDMAQREIDDIRFVMSCEQGRRVVWSVLEKGRVFSAISPMDAMAMAFNEGQRNLALELFQRVVTVSLETQKIVAALPPLDIREDG